jgi:hypothetical protein
MSLWRAHISVCILCQLLALWLSRLPSGVGPTDLPLLVVIEGVVLTILFFGSRRVPRNTRSPHHEVNVHRGRVSKIGIWSVPLTVVLLALNIPLRLGFVLSKPSLQRIAVGSLALQNSSARFVCTDVDQWAGAYSIEGVAGGPHEPTTLFVKTYRFFAGSSEFLYSPKAVPPHFDANLGGGWYAYRWYGSWIG